MGPYGGIYLNELPVKVCKFRRWFDESYFLLDRSCTGSTPRPCGTLSDIHHRLHTWIRLIARSVPSSWLRMFHIFWLGSNSLKQKTKERSKQLLITMRMTQWVCRYVKKASFLHITGTLWCLRWMLTTMNPSIPLQWIIHGTSFTSIETAHTHTPILQWTCVNPFLWCVKKPNYLVTSGS